MLFSSGKLAAAKRIDVNNNDYAVSIGFGSQ